MIDVLVPVLGRPGNARALVDSYVAAGGAAPHILFLCSPGDHEQIEACLETSARTEIVDWRPGRGDYARKMNHGFRKTKKQFLLLGADDIAFSPGWLPLALAVMLDQTGVVATNDLCNGQVMRGEFGTHCLVRRSYIEEQGGSLDGPGFLLHEGYDHNFVDRELCHLAQSRNAYAFARNSHIRHLHPMRGKGRDDATYQKGIRRFDQDRRLFIARSRRWGGIGVRPYERGASRRSGHRDIVGRR